MTATARKPRPRRVRIVISENDRRKDEVRARPAAGIRNRRGGSIVAQIVDEQPDASEEHGLSAEDPELGAPILADCAVIQPFRVGIGIATPPVIAARRGFETDRAEVVVRILGASAVMQRIEPEAAGDAEESPFGELHDRRPPSGRRGLLLGIRGAREKGGGDDRGEAGSSHRKLTTSPSTGATTIWPCWTMGGCRSSPP